MRREIVPIYGSRDWLRRLPRSHRPVGAINGCVVVALPTNYQWRTPFAKVVGGTAEAPTLIGLSPEEAEKVMWTTSVAAPQTVLVGATDSGPGATPWVAGGLLILAAVGITKANRRFAT